MANINEYQSILDVFLLQGLVNFNDYQKIKDQYKNNAAIEEFLLKNQLLSIDSINRAYSIIYKMPFVDLKNLKIPQNVLDIIPVDFVKKYEIAPFSFNNRVLNLAIARPAKITTILPQIERYFQGKVRLINLYITTPADVAIVIKQYSEKNTGLLLNKTKYPTVFLKNQNISKDLIKLLPADFIVKYHLIIFGKREENHFLVATDRADNPETLKAIHEVESQNRIFLEIFSTSSEDIAYIFDLINADKSRGDGPVKNLETQKEPSSADQTEQDDSILSGLKDFLKNDEKRPELTIDSVQKVADTKPDQTGQKKTDTVQKNNQPMAHSEPEKPSESVLAEKDEDIGKLLDRDIENKADLEEIIKTGAVPKIVAAIINYALFERASDIHFEPEEKMLRVRYRIDGILTDFASLSTEIQPQIISRVKILANLKLDESRIPQDGRFDVNFKKKQVDIRVSSLPTVRGEKIVMRLLDKSQGILSLEDLGMTGQAFKKTLEAVAKPYGIIISTGPTGSGKSTTLYAILNRISVPAVNIVTIEDPVEYEIPGINQCQIKPKIGFTFAEGLRSILRQDPNVIMVGEVRDTETANMATHAALTGHLVLTTLHTNDAAGALPRLTNMGVEPFLITSSINLIIGQRLVRRICPNCREEIKVTDSLRKQVMEELSQIPANNKDDRARVKNELKFYHGKGCRECGQGYRGRLGIFEVLSVSSKIEEMVIGRSGTNEILKQAQSEGMITMRQDGLLKALEGLTTIDEVFRVTATF